jgi:hypothetical protein
MTGNRGRGSRLQLWVAVPVSGLVAGAGLAALTAQGLDQARGDRSADVPTAAEESDDAEGEDPVAAALRVRATDGERPTLLQPRAAASPALPVQPTSLMVATVLASPVWSGAVEDEYVAGPAVPPPPVVVVASPPAPPPAAPPAPPAPPPPPVVPPPVVQPPPVTPPVEPVDPEPEPPGGETPPAEEPGYGTETPPAEEPVDPPPADPTTEPVVETGTEETTVVVSEPPPPGPLVETVG